MFFFLISAAHPEFFIPPRGRRTNQNEELPKRNKNLNKLFSDLDIFVPNRGKKNGASKFNDILLPEDLFFPNRGKKDLFEIQRHNDDNVDDIEKFFYSQKGKKSRSRESSFEKFGDDDLFYPNRGKKNSNRQFNGILNPDDLLFYPNRGKRDYRVKRDTDHVRSTQSTPPLSTPLQPSNSEILKENQSGSKLTSTLKKSDEILKRQKRKTGNDNSYSGGHWNNLSSKENKDAGFEWNYLKQKQVIDRQSHIGNILFINTQRWTNDRTARYRYRKMS